MISPFRNAHLPGRNSTFREGTDEIPSGKVLFLPGRCAPPYRHLLFICLTWLLLFAYPQQAKAHANLGNSQPAKGQRLTSAPSEIRLDFSEALDPQFSHAELRTGTGDVLTTQLIPPAPSTPRTLRLSLPTLPTGVYSIIWRVRSVVDGHITNGSVPFSVGDAGPLPSSLPPPGSPAPVAARPATVDTLLRWLGYLALTFCAGAPFFALLVWRPIYRRELQELEGRNDVERLTQVDQHLTRWLRKLLLIGVGSLVLASAAFVFWQAQLAARSIGATSMGEALNALLAGRTGMLFAIRMAGAIVLGWVTLHLPPAGAGSAWDWLLALLFNLILLATFSLQSHSAALGNAVAISLDYIHLLAMCVWIGGLLPLLLALRQRAELSVELPAALVRRFSALALLSVGTLAISGLYVTFLHVVNLEALVATRYGQALIVKVALFAVLILLGAFNFFVLSPRLTRVPKLAGWLGYTTRSEIICAAVVLAAVGLMTGTPPAFETVQAQNRIGLVDTASAEGVDFTLWIAPARSGDNEFAVDVLDPRPGAAEVPATVLIRFTHLTMEMGEQEITLQPEANGRFSTGGSYLSMVGRWQAEVIVRRSGFNDARHRFEFDTQAPVFP